MLNIQTPIARNNDPNASHEAGEYMNASGHRARHQEMAVKAVELYAGMTSLEIATHANLCRFMLARRLPECELAKRVRRGQERRCSISKRKAATWYPAGVVEQLGLFGNG